MNDRRNAEPASIAENKCLVCVLGISAASRPSWSSVVRERDVERERREHEAGGEREQERQGVPAPSVDADVKSARRLASRDASSPNRSTQCTDRHAMLARPPARPATHAPAMPCSTVIGCVAVRAASARARIVARHHTMPAAGGCASRHSRLAVVVQRARDLDQIGADRAAATCAASSRA